MFVSILSIPAFSRALVALVASGLAFPAVGTLILCLEMIPARFAVMHVALLGAAVGMLLGVDVTVAALAASLLASLFVAKLGESGGTSAGGPLGLVMILSLALAFIIFHKTDVNAIEAFGMFWGTILALGPGELRLVLVVAVAVPLVLFAFLRPITAVLYDRELASASGYPARVVHYGLVALVCLVIGVAMRLTGALMADATTILPALAARNLKKSFAATLLLGACFGLVSNLGGFALALAWDIPTSPGIIVVGTALVALSAVAGTRTGGGKSGRVAERAGSLSSRRR